MVSPPPPDQSYADCWPLIAQYSGLTLGNNIFTASQATITQKVNVGGGGIIAASLDNGGMPEGLDWVALCRESKPLIAAVNGAAVGIGLTMILPFDAIVASEKAKLGMFFIRVGLVPELASTRLLAQRVGFGMASEMCLSGRLVPAAEAAERRLVERVAGPEALLDEALGIAGEIGAHASPQLRMIKRLLTENAMETDLTEVQRRESELMRECWKSPEHAEAVSAFLEKREPNFAPR